MRTSWHAFRRPATRGKQSPLALWNLHYLRELDASGFIDRLYAEPVGAPTHVEELTCDHSTTVSCGKCGHHLGACVSDTPSSVANQCATTHVCAGRGAVRTSMSVAFNDGFGIEVQYTEPLTDLR